MQRSPVEALGYVVLEVSDLGKWRHFATDLLGLMAVDHADGSIDLRMDDYSWRIRLVEGPADDLKVVGWEVPDRAALDELANILRSSGVEAQAASDAELAERGVLALVKFQDPDGNMHEAFYGPLLRTEAPFVSPTGTTFKTGRQGLGHVVLSVSDKPRMEEFFTKLLGFRVSDYIRTEVVPGRPLEIAFLRCNGRHHSLAMAQASIPKKIIHLMFEATNVDQVGRALYKCLEEQVHLSFTLGRHSNDGMLSFYPVSPSGFDIEYGCDGIEVNDETWHVVTHATNSAWGHVFQRPPRPSPKP